MSKNIFYIEPTSITGSTNELRNDLGICWASSDVPVQSLSASSMNQLDFSNFDEVWNQADMITLSPARWLNDDIFSRTLGLRYAELQPLYQATASYEKLIPNYVIPGRLYGAATSSGGSIKNDEEWKTYLQGGSFGNKIYKGIYSETTFENFGFKYNVPYSAAEIKTLATVGTQVGGHTASISYSYNLYFPELEKRQQGTTERALPSIEFLKLGDNAGGESKDIRDMVTLEGIYDNTKTLDDILSPQRVDYFPFIQLPPSMASSTTYQDITKNLKEYLLTGSQLELSSSTLNSVSSQLSNLLYTNDLLQEGRLTPDNPLTYYPAYININFPVDLNQASEEGHFRSLMESVDFSSNMLDLLKGNFKGSISPATKDFITKTEHDDMGFGTETDSTTTLRTQDFMKMLTMHYKDTRPHNDFYNVPASSARPYTSEQNIMSSNPRDGLRFFKGRSLLSMLSQVSSFLSSADPTNGSTSLSPKLELDIEGKNGLYGFLNKAGNSNYHETIAYRIEKTQAASGQSIQDIWVFNDRAREIAGKRIKFMDSQVKYGEGYTYTIYAYVLVAGMSYKMGDLIIGRNIGTAQSGAISTNVYNRHGAEGSYCIQFHDPDTHKTTEQLFSKLAVGASYAADNDDELHGTINTIAMGEDTGESAGIYAAENMMKTRWGTNAQIVSHHPYLADFNLYYEPGLKMVEVPLFSKTLSILDHPAGDLDVTPFQKIDNSQTLGFFVKVESFEPSATFPAVITDADREYKTQYLNSNNIGEGAALPAPSVSNQAALQIFRMDKKPQSLTEFKDHLYKTISLKIKDTQEYLSTYVFYDKVSTNKKYYYLMRFINEHGHAGHPSPTIEAELINDGGYKYSLFDNLFVDELSAPGLTTPSTTFKKLMHILPTTSQLFLQPNNIDFQQPASQALADELIQVGITDDSIFDQEFKLRLTSKKTGKKIDLNLTFNLTTES